MSADIWDDAQSAGSRSWDEELLLMGRIGRALNKLDQAGRDRVLTYLIARHRGAALPTAESGPLFRSEKPLS